MKNYKNLRSQGRTNFDTPVLFSNDMQNDYQRAMMHNFSDGGLYFESKEPLRTGSKIDVKTMEFRSINKCKVKWCGRIDSDGEEMFGVGVECEL